MKKVEIVTCQDNDTRKQAEEQVAQAVKQLRQTLVRNMEDIVTVLDRYHMTHDYECEESAYLLALTKGYKGIWRVLKEIDNKLNKETHEEVDKSDERGA